MILITTALYCEALPLIQYFHLKKDTAFAKFQVFKNEDIVLLITKTGTVQAAIGTASLCSLITPTLRDIFLNLGVCGSSREDDPAGSIFLCNKIMDLETMRCFYPDILFAHPFKERWVLTSPKVINTDGHQISLPPLTGGRPISPMPYLIDMEASGLYQAASYFYQPHQMFFLKVVSDYLMNTDITPDKITGLIQKNIDLVMEWISQVQDELSKIRPVFTMEEEKYTVKLTEALQLSSSMELKLRQLLKYSKLKEGSFTDRIRDFMADKTLPCKTKSEGKKYFEQLKQLFL